MYLHVVRVCIVCVCTCVCVCMKEEERETLGLTVMRVKSETDGLHGHSAVFCKGNNSSLIY